MTLTDDQVASFRRDGFLWVEQITSSDEIRQLEPLYEELMKTPRQEIKAGDEAPATIEAVAFEHTHPELFSTTYVRNARAAAGKILDDDPATLVPVAQLIFKPPGTTRTIPWHQDEAFWEQGIRYEGVAVWMPLDKVTVESGCMQFIPGSHLELVEHVPDATQPGLKYVPDTGPNAPVACPLPPGGATFHHFRTMHYTGPNTTNSPRRAIVTRFYGGPDRPQLSA